MINKLTNNNYIEEYLSLIPKYKDFEDKIVLVTGGTGDIGSTICKVFANQHSHVIVSSRGCTGNNAEGLIQALSEIKPNANHKYIRADICSKIANVCIIVYSWTTGIDPCFLCLNRLERLYLPCHCIE